MVPPANHFPVASAEPGMSRSRPSPYRPRRRPERRTFSTSFSTTWGFGWTDTFGGLVETPHMTRLAKGGISYTNHHTTALCSPTRACLLTGRNHHSVGMANITELATGFPGYNGIQPPDKAAIASMLHQHGYTPRESRSRGSTSSPLAILAANGGELSGSASGSSEPGTE
jgi:hypothetical protein